MMCNTCYKDMTKNEFCDKSAIIIAKQAESGKILPVFASMKLNYFFGACFNTFASI